jgi:hypothetical protein
MGWTADEFKGQGGCGVVATDIVGVTKDYDAEVVEMIVSFADRLDWDGNCEREGSGVRIDDFMVSQVEGI